VIGASSVAADGIAAGASTVLPAMMGRLLWGEFRRRIHGLEAQ
jgi:hypothetical protein